MLDQQRSSGSSGKTGWRRGLLRWAIAAIVVGLAFVPTFVQANFDPYKVRRLALEAQRGALRCESAASRAGRCVVVVLIVLLCAVCAVARPMAALRRVQVLGVTRSSSASEVKKAYKAQAKQWHPDKNPDSGAQARFLDVNQAYEVLTDPVKREDFDRHGSVRTKQQREQEEATQRWNAQYRAQQQAYSQQRGGYYGYDPAYSRRVEAYARSTDDDALASSVRLTTSNFDYMVSPVTTQTHTNEGWVVFVHAGTCEPCQSLHPAWTFFARGLRKQFRGLLKTGRINSEFERGLIQKLGVRSLPTIMVFSSSPSGEPMARATMNLLRDPRGNLLMPTVNQLLDFAAGAVWPTNKEGRTSTTSTGFWSNAGGGNGGATVPLFDITAGIGAAKDVRAGAATLRARLASFVSEHAAYPESRKGGDISSPFVHVYVISRHTHPTPLFKYAAHRWGSRMRFAHISLPLLAHSDTLLRELASAFPGVDLPLSVTEGSFVLVSREPALRTFQPLTGPGGEVRRVEEEYLDVDSLATLLAPWTLQNIPRLSGDNFFEACFPQYVAGTSSASASHTPAAHRECFILFTETQETAHKVMLGLFPSSPASASASSSAAAASSTPGDNLSTEASEAESEDVSQPPSLPRHIQFGWMSPREQAPLMSWLRAAILKHRSKALPTTPTPGAPIHAILLRARDSTFAVLPQPSLDSPSITSDIASWLTTGQTPMAWIDGRAIAGGMPFPLPATSPSSSVGAAIMQVLTAPWRLVQMAVGTLTPNAAVAGAGGDSSNSVTMLLVLVFTVVFLVTTSSMLKFVN